MKGILVFKLPEEQVEFNHAQNAINYLAIIDELEEKLRHKYKYEDQVTIDIEEVRKMIYELKKEYYLID